VTRRADGQWQPPVEVANGVQYLNLDGTAHRHPCWNPVLFQMPEGKLLLFYKCGPDPEQWWGMWTTSADHGETWEPPCQLPEGILGPVKNKPILLADGSLLCGTSTEQNGTDWRVHFERLHPDGKTWSRTAAVNDGKTISAIQPSILTHGEERLQAVGRSRNKQIFEIWSDDNGQTWGEMTLTELPNSSTGTDAVTLKDGRQLLVYNHTPKGRTPLNVAVSDDGKSWQAALILENEPGEYSYPAVIQAADGMVHTTYTWKRKLIRHVVIDPRELTLRPIVDGVWPK
jgi:predicted neuraminidase